MSVPAVKKAPFVLALAVIALGLVMAIASPTARAVEHVNRSITLSQPPIVVVGDHPVPVDFTAAINDPAGAGVPVTFTVGGRVVATVPAGPNGVASVRHMVAPLAPHIKQSTMRVSAFVGSWTTPITVYGPAADSKDMHVHNATAPDLGPVFDPIGILTSLSAATGLSS